MANPAPESEVDVELAYGRSEVIDSLLPRKPAKEELERDRTPNRHRWARRIS